jgi:hypothetical protein
MVRQAHVLKGEPTPVLGTKHSGYGREHAIQTLQEFGYTKMIRFPSGTGTIPTWRGVTDIGSLHMPKYDQ